MLRSLETKRDDLVRRVELLNIELRGLNEAISGLKTASAPDAAGSTPLHHDVSRGYQVGTKGYQGAPSGNGADPHANANDGSLTAVIRRAIADMPSSFTIADIEHWMEHEYDGAKAPRQKTSNALFRLKERREIRLLNTPKGRELARYTRGDAG